MADGSLSPAARRGTRLAPGTPERPQRWKHRGARANIRGPSPSTVRCRTRRPLTRVHTGILIGLPAVPIGMRLASWLQAQTRRADVPGLLCRRAGRPGLGARPAADLQDAIAGWVPPPRHDSERQALTCAASPGQDAGNQAQVANTAPDGPA